MKNWKWMIAAVLGLVSMSWAAVIENIAPNAVVTGSGGDPGALVNQARDGDGTYAIDYSPGGTNCSIYLKWSEAVTIDQAILYKKLGGTAGGYTAPGSSRLWVLDADGNRLQVLYGSGNWGIAEDPILKVLTMNFAPVTILPGQQLILSCWTPNGNWILMDELEVMSVPEPASLLLGIAGAAWLRRRMNK